MFAIVDSLLQIAGYETVHTVSVASLFEAAQAGTASLILLGLDSGCDERLLMTRLNAMTETPIIALCPPGRIDNDGSMPNGVATCLPKPPSMTALLAAIKRVRRVALKTA